MNYELYGKIGLLNSDEYAKGEKFDLMIKFMECGTLSDFAIFLGASYSNIDGNILDKNARGPYWVSNGSEDGMCYCINHYGVEDASPSARKISTRPVINLDDISDIPSDKIILNNGCEEVEFGEYPQYVVDSELSKKLDLELSMHNLKETGKTYTINSNVRVRYPDFDSSFCPKEIVEYEYSGKKYVKCQLVIPVCFLSDCNQHTYPEEVWFEVSPITWLLDRDGKKLVSKKILLSGIKICDGKYSGNFNDTVMYMFLNEYFAKDIIPSVVKKDTLEEQSDSLKKK